MKNIIFAVLSLLAATSCTKYNITGSSDLQDVEGRMLFLKSFADEKLINIDSCDVIHGKFKFSGNLDSVRIVMLCMEDAAIMPVVLEDGQIDISINAQKQECSGTPLNDTLRVFNNAYKQILAKQEELPHLQSQAIMNGEDMEVVNRHLAMKQQELYVEEEKLITDFITNNFDNCLGPYVFQLATDSYEYPILTPWIDALMMKATDTFKNNASVAEYMSAAKENQDIMTGMTDSQNEMLEQPQMPTPPTPNELAKPQE